MKIAKKNISKAKFNNTLKKITNHDQVVIISGMQACFHHSHTNQCD